MNLIRVSNEIQFRKQLAKFQNRRSISDDDMVVMGNDIFRASHMEKKANYSDHEIIELNEKFVNWAEENGLPRFRHVDQQVIRSDLEEGQVDRLEAGAEHLVAFTNNGRYVVKVSKTKINRDSESGNTSISNAGGKIPLLDSDELAYIHGAPHQYVERMAMANIYLDSHWELLGYSLDENGMVSFVTRQPNAKSMDSCSPATETEIASDMRQRGFIKLKDSDQWFSPSERVVVSDLNERNVKSVVDEEGHRRVFYIDPIIARLSGVPQV